MYMRVVRSQVDPAKVDEAISQVAQDLDAAIRRQPGYQSLTAGVDRASGRAIIVSIWDTEEHARYSADVLGDVPSRIQALGVQAEPPEIFEVR